jgi:hypothetical protein
VEPVAAGGVVCCVQAVTAIIIASPTAAMPRDLIVIPYKTSHAFLASRIAEWPATSAGYLRTSGRARRFGQRC